MTIYAVMTELTPLQMPIHIPFPLVYFSKKEDAENELENLIRSKRQYPKSKFYIKPIEII